MVLTYLVLSSLSLTFDLELLELALCLEGSLCAVVSDLLIFALVGQDR